MSGGIVLGKEGKPITKATIQAAREKAKTMGLKVANKFEPKRRG